MFKPILRLGWFCCLTVLLLPEQQAVAGITVAPRRTPRSSSARRWGYADPSPFFGSLACS